jgi:hypothetical protein
MNRRMFFIGTGAGTAALASLPAFATTARAAIAQSFVNPRDYGVVGDGKVDDSVGMNACLKYASDVGKSVLIGADMRIRVTRKLFIYGNASIVGESRESSMVILQTLPGEPPAPEHWIHCGIAASSMAPRTWRGRIDNVQFLLKSPTAEVVTFHAAENVAFTNCIIDQVALGHQAGNCLKSGFSNLCSPGGSCTPRYGQIVNNTLRAWADGAPVGGGGGGINLGNADSILIAGNHIEGFGDDAIAVISCQHCVIRDNWARGIRSRIGSFSGRQNSFYNNYLERQPGRDGVWQPAAMFYATFLQSPYAIPPTPENITFSGNQAVLPAGAPDAGNTPADFMLIGGVHGCVVHGNIFINNSRQTVLPRLRLIPMGLDPNLPGDHVSRPRSVEISGNIMSGSFPGTIEEQLGEGPNGPITYGGNIASGFTIKHPNSFRIAALTIADPPVVVDSNQKV